MKEFLLLYVKTNRKYWQTEPKIFAGDEFQDCIVLQFGKPKVAAFAHMDTTGFTVRYQDQLVPIGSPDIKEDDVLTGEDELGFIECQVRIDDDYHVFYKFGRAVVSGTSLTYQTDYSEDEQFIFSPYLDNRAGIFNLLKVAETLENGLLVFSCWEEHGGGSVPYLVKFLYEKFKITKALISDLTWVTDGVSFNKGVVISMRDRNIPRRSFINQIIDLAEASGISYQLEVEGSGSSDGKEIQTSPYPIDWCFIGAPEKHPHSCREVVCKKDLLDMISLYKVLFEKL